MPHKRSKSSIRLAERNAKGKDLPPKTNDVHLRDFPKGAMRILNAAKVQEEYNKRKREEKKAENIQSSSKKGLNQKGNKDVLKIKEGEKMGDFSRRVENAMASDINATIKATKGSKNKRKRRNEKEEKEEDDDGGNDKGRKVNKSSQKKLKEQNVERDWQVASKSKRLNDIVDRPPTLTKAPRGHSVDSLRRKAELEQEREKAIKAYRSIKEKKMEKYS